MYVIPTEFEIISVLTVVRKSQRIMFSYQELKKLRLPLLCLPNFAVLFISLSQIIV